MVMQLMGQTYGQVKKQDEMIVGSSAQLQGKSAEMKQMFEQMAKVPTAERRPGEQPAPAPQQAPAPQPEAAPVPQGPPAATITPEQAMAELQQAPQVTSDIQITPPLATAASVQQEQGMLDFSEPSGIEKLIELQKETNLLLKGIKLQLENSNVRPKRKPAAKKAKSKIA